MTPEQNREYQRRYREKNKEALKAYGREYRRSMKRDEPIIVRRFIPNAIKTLRKMLESVKNGNQLEMKDNFNRQAELYSTAIVALEEIQKLRDEMIPYQSH